MQRLTQQYEEQIQQLQDSGAASAEEINRLENDVAALEQQTSLLQRTISAPVEMDPRLSDSIDNLKQTIADANALEGTIRRSSAAFDAQLRAEGLAPGPARDAREEQLRTAKEKELQEDPLIQRMLAAGIISLKDIIEGKTIKLLEDPATRQAVLNRLDTLEEQSKDKLASQVKRYNAEQTMAFTRTLPNSEFKMYVPPRYAKADMPGAKRKQPPSVTATIGFPTGAYSR